MAEDFGDFGDEAVLGRDEYLKEIAELQAMDYQEHQEVLREMALDEALPQGESQGVFGDMDDDPEDEPAEDSVADLYAEGGMSDAEADAATLASCGWGMDEDY